ncbi:MAG: sulfur carrier protein ThiS [Psychromonas sp.]|nr:sulfur carrier protein ThiS [Psychromonas sp.]
MKITVNEVEKEIQPSSIEQFLKDIDSPIKGSALAINGVIISRVQWPNYQLQENDSLSLFQVIAGG